MRHERAPYEPDGIREGDVLTSFRGARDPDGISGSSKDVDSSSDSAAFSVSRNVGVLTDVRTKESESQTRRTRDN